MKERKEGEPAAPAADEVDQERQGYYYDDTTGYETYDPDSENDEDDVAPSQPSTSETRG